MTKGYYIPRFFINCFVGENRGLAILLQLTIIFSSLSLVCLCDFLEYTAFWSA
jgi:hypothetical protein